MSSCAICGEPTRNRARDADGDLVCHECRGAIAYYAQMTDEQWAMHIFNLAAFARFAEGAS